MPRVLFPTLLGIGIGILLILAIARWGPPLRASGPRPEGPEMPPEELEALVRALAAGLGLEVLSLACGAEGGIDATLRDPRPVAGSRLILRATSVLAHGRVDAPAVLDLADTVRSDGAVSKGILIALAGFTDEARNAAAGAAAALELYDAPGLEALTREIVPERAESLRRYRGS